MFNDSFDNLDGLIIDETIFTSANILFIGRKDISLKIENVLSYEAGYHLFSTTRMDEAINYMLQFNYPIILLDNEDTDIDVVAISNTLRELQKTVRIVIVTSSMELSIIQNVINGGNISAVLPLYLSERELLKIIKEQDAKYSIDQAMTSFVSNPPTLSKASFLLMDPTLLFGDETQPLNFVGILINSKTVSRFSHFFEKTLVQDELLLASYLASINALGEELFKNQEPMKEINFGGISVIFRFFEGLQFSFLVRNLTKYNCEKAEERINNLMDVIIPNFRDILTENYLSREEENDLKLLLEDFNQFDDLELYVYHETKKQQENKTKIIHSITSFSRNARVNNLLNLGLNIEETFKEEYNVSIVSDEDMLFNELKTINSGILLLDSKLENVLSVANFAKEIIPSIVIICIHENASLCPNIVDGVNQDLFDNILSSDGNDFNYDELIMLCENGLKKSKEMIEKAFINHKSQISTVDPIVARSKLRIDSESYKEEEVPQLSGIIISYQNEPVFKRYWVEKANEILFDNNLLTNLVSSLKQVGGEMFVENESIGSLDFGGAELFVKHQQDYIYLYFVKNMKPNTAVVVNKELEALTVIFNELIVEAKGEIPFNLLQPIFEKMADTAHNNLTTLFRDLV